VYTLKKLTKRGREKGRRKELTKLTSRERSRGLAVLRFQTTEMAVVKIQKIATTSL
jgi:hypothetical protein